MKKKDSKMNTPKIGICAAFEQGYETLQFVFKQGFDIEFVASCHRDKTKYKRYIHDLCLKNETEIVRNVNVNEDNFNSFLSKKNIDIMILSWWPDIIKPKAINSVKIGWVNLHPSLLPYGRGKHGYFWSIVENTPFGVSIHFISEGIDTGPILFQKRIPVSIEDTGQSLYEKGVTEVIKLFKEKFSDIVNLKFKPVGQDDQIATTHFAREIESKTIIDLNKHYKAIDLINIIRGRTFWNGPSASFVWDGDEYYIRTEIKKIKRGNNRK